MRNVQYLKFSHLAMINSCLQSSKRPSTSHVWIISRYGPKLLRKRPRNSEDWDSSTAVVAAEYKTDNNLENVVDS